MFYLHSLTVFYYLNLFSYITMFLILTTGIGAPNSLYLGHGVTWAWQWVRPLVRTVSMGPQSCRGLPKRAQDLSVTNNTCGEDGEYGSSKSPRLAKEGLGTRCHESHLKKDSDGEAQRFQEKDKRSVSSGWKTVSAWWQIRCGP